MGVNPETAAGARKSARRTRFAIFAQVSVAVLLSVAAVLLVTWLSERRGFRARFDLTRDAENTLDPVSIAVIEKLPENVAIDVFFRAGEYPLQQVTAVAQERMRKLLRRASDESGGRVAIEDHDLSDLSKLPARAQARMVELKLKSVEPGGLIVVSTGTRRELVRLRPEIADLDPGQPGGQGQQYQPPRMVNFRGEEVLMSALLKVSQGETRTVYLSQGHGEPGTQALDPRGLSLLKSELEGDGFKVSDWNGAKQGSLPEDCDVLAVLGPEQVFTSAESAEVRRFVDSGGRLIASPGARRIEGTDSLAAILAGFGVNVRMSGFVASPVPSITGQMLFELEECGDLAIGKEGMPAQNPITEPIRRAPDSRVWLRAARVLERGEVPAGGRVLDLLRAPEESWHELPQGGSEDTYDWKPDDNEERGRFSVAMQAAFPLRRPAAPRFAKNSNSRPESRVVVIGSTETFENFWVPSNRDFLLNSFNWLASREYRVKVTKANVETRRIDLKSPGVLPRATLIAMVLLPLGCALAGIFTVWTRKRR